MVSSKTRFTAVRLPNDLADQLDAVVLPGTTKTAIIVDAVREYLEKLLQDKDSI